MDQHSSSRTCACIHRAADQLLAPALILVFTVLVGEPAAAQLCERGMSVRVSPAGFALVDEEIRGLIPDTFDLPAISATVVDWPLTHDDARVEMPPTPGAVALRGVGFEMVGGALRMRVAIDVDVSGPATISNAYAGFGSDRCQVELRLSQVQFEADFALRTLGNHIVVELGQTRVSSNEPDRVVRISDCTVGEIYNALSSALGRETEVGTRQWLEAFARSRVPPLLEQALTRSMETSPVDRPLRLRGQLREAHTDARGIVLSADVAVEPLNQGFADCLAVRAPPLAPSCTKPAPSPPASDTMYAVTFSEGLVNRALHATWRTGLLCIDSRRLDIPELASTIDKLSATLGLAPGSRVIFRAVLRQPPRIQFSLQDGARLIVDDLELRVQLDGADGQDGDLRLHTSLSVAATARLDPATNSLGFGFGAVGVRRLELGHAERDRSAIQLDPARLQRFVGDVIVPLLRRRLERSQLSPAVVHVEQYLLLLRNVFVADGHVLLDGDAHRPSTVDDVSPPETQLLEAPGALVGPQILALKVAGSDRQTPAALLRFQVRVDGGAWSEPRFGALVDVVAHGGQHRVEIAAVDLRGNVDPTPLTLTLTVDDVPPEIVITSRPEPLIPHEGFAVGFIAQDDRTAPAAIRFTAELLHVEDNGGALALVERKELAGGAARARFPAQRNGLYRIRITAHDQAGNVSSEEIGLVVESTTCATGPHTGSAPLAGWLPVGLLWLARRRRPRHRRSRTR